MTKRKCLFWEDGRCNSDYGKNMKCDGIKVPEQCPWKNGGSFAMAIKDHPNKRVIKMRKTSEGKV